MRDNWCVGYSDRYTVGVWMGNFSGSPMWNVSGVTGAAPVWLEIMNSLHRDTPSTAPSAPAGVVLQQVISAHSDGSDKRQEWFIAGTEQSTILSRASQERSKIMYPSSDAVIAVDPDIPEERNRVFFEVSAAVPGLRLVLDDAVIGPAPVVSWFPVRGLHRLSLVGQDGVVADQITFEVR